MELKSPAGDYLDTAVENLHIVDVVAAAAACVAAVAFGPPDYYADVKLELELEPELEHRLGLELAPEPADFVEPVVLALAAAVAAL